MSHFWGAVQKTPTLPIAIGIGERPNKNKMWRINNSLDKLSAIKQNNRLCILSILSLLFSSIKANYLPPGGQFSFKNLVNVDFKCSVVPSPSLMLWLLLG